MPLNIIRIRFLIINLVLLLSLPFPLHAGSYVRPELLISPEELSRIMRNPDVRIIDAESEDTYNNAHIPGAVNIHYLKLAGVEDRKKNGFPLSVKKAEKVFSDAGIDRKTLVVVYDEGSGVFASGVWFVLNFFGHKEVRVLEGGARRWISEGRPVTKTAPLAKKRRFIATPDPALIVTSGWLNDNLNTKGIVVLDARSLKEFTGMETRPGASRGGHLPGVMHIEWTEVTDKNGNFKPADEIENVFRQRGITKESKIITYCHSGIGRSTKLALALKLIGYDNVFQYTGSWEEWSGDPHLPIER